MGRTKQPFPLRREASNGWVNHAVEDPNEKIANGDLKHHENERSDDKVAEPGAAVQEVQQAGFVQLMICVGGIYGSL